MLNFDLNEAVLNIAFFACKFLYIVLLPKGEKTQKTAEHKRFMTLDVF